MCVPLFDHRSSACMCVHVREHTCDVEKDEPICSAKFEYYFRMCGYVKANVYVIVMCCERTKRVALHRVTVCSRVAGGEERSRRCSSVEAGRERGEEVLAWWAPTERESENIWTRRCFCSS